ncbi:MAG: nicotinate-nucleotide--dimethylbenzimidazole phosphoribosyltransferase, partial [Cytophagaceae bacterium]|nr:nicotinate-nucleotide--dimethylbenzimidazole phosphoribosyltransferase [Cytophagaceae bacterium]
MGGGAGGGGGGGGWVGGGGGGGELGIGNTTAASALFCAYCGIAPEDAVG